MGISPKRLLGWEPRTFYHYDDDGRLVSSTVEPEWDEEQRGWLFALDDYEADLCDGCGQPLSQTMAPGADESYWAETVGRCHACDAIGAAAEGRTNTIRPHLLRWHVHRRDVRGTGG